MAFYLPLIKCITLSVREIERAIDRDRGGEERGERRQKLLKL